MFLMNIVNINGQFIPGARVGQKAVLIGKKLYFTGGRSFDKETGLISDLFYYDFGAGLSDAKLVDLRSQEGIKMNLPYMIWHTANIGGTNKDSIFMLGGLGTVESSNNLVYQFDTNTNTTSMPIIQGITPPRREDMDTVSYGGKIYIFSGRMEGVNDEIYYDNFDILDTVNLVWNVGSPVNAPLPRFLYTATLVNGVIYYIGGVRKSAVNNISYSVLMSNIYLYDIATNTWSLKEITVGNIPEPRFGHSAVLVGDKICIYGGLNPNGVVDAPAMPTIALLDTNTFIWSTPQLENINTPKLIDNNVPNLLYHTATLIYDNLMFVTFGNLTAYSLPRTLNRYYYIFNFGQPKVQWFRIEQNDIGNPNANIPINPKTPNSITPKTPPSTTSSGNAANTSAKSTAAPATSSSDQQSLGNPVIIGLSIGLAAIGLGTIVAFSLIYRNSKKNQNSATGGASGALDTSTGSVMLQIPSNLQHSPTPALHRYSPGQEYYSSLPLSQQERYSQRSSSYSPGSETPPI
ncbi:unnamed protein product [Rhizophagus irregularis]|nr:unnamed protein product [Rhizophagus irregularis]